MLWMLCTIYGKLNLKPVNKTRLITFLKEYKTEFKDEFINRVKKEIAVFYRHVRGRFNRSFYAPITLQENGNLQDITIHWHSNF